MGIIRDYDGDFTEEEEYLKTINETIKGELSEIKNIINNIQGDGTWDSIEANNSVEMINEIVNRLDKIRDTKMTDANNILSGIDTLLAVYEQVIL